MRLGFCNTDKTKFSLRYYSDKECKVRAGSLKDVGTSGACIPDGAGSVKLTCKTATAKELAEVKVEVTSQSTIEVVAVDTKDQAKIVVETVCESLSKEVETAAKEVSSGASVKTTSYGMNLGNFGQVDHQCTGSSRRLTPVRATLHGRRLNTNPRVEGVSKMTFKAADVQSKLATMSDTIKTKVKAQKAKIGENIKKGVEDKIPALKGKFNVTVNDPVVEKPVFTAPTVQSPVTTAPGTTDSAQVTTIGTGFAACLLFGMLFWM